MRPSPYTVALALAFAALLHAGPGRADAVQTPHVEAELIAENTAASKTGDNGLALRLKPEQDWHIYWRNPGDSGKPTTLAWTLPEGVTAGEIQWPYPHRLVTGDIVNYGYDAETLHLLPLTLPESWPADRPVELKAKASWLVCKDVCIPGTADLSLTLPVADAPARNEQWVAAFADARAALPQPAPADWKLIFNAADGDFTLGLDGARISTGGDIEFFPYANDVLNHSAPARLANDDKHGLRISQKLSDFFVKAPPLVEGVLVVHDGDSTKVWAVRAQPGDVPVVPLSAVKPATAAAPPAAEQPLIVILLLAFAGGLILNLMPCVFPLLSIKAISIIESRDRNRGRKIVLAFAYTGGVILTFVGLAVLLLLLRNTGSAVGWGFQLQQPVFVATLAYLFFAMGLSLSGVVEFGTRWMGVGQSLSDGGGPRGAFFTGVLAVVVASPCTAPFMGVALGYALFGHSAAISLLVFAALGLGFALPLPLIGLIPAFGRLLPKPGRWMQTFKEVMAFPLYLTVIWLLWVLGGLTDRNGMLVALLGLTLIAFALWLWQRRGAVPTLFKAAALIGAFALLALPQIRTAAPATPLPATNAAGKAAAFEPWSAERLAQLRADKRTVFVNFTADWCITCKVNERVALASDSVHQAFVANDVVWLEGDWTRSDPAISAVLAQFNRSGVPLYLVYVKGGEPKVLPQLLTPDIVISAVKS